MEGFVRFPAFFSSFKSSSLEAETNPVSLLVFLHLSQCKSVRYCSQRTITSPPLTRRVFPLPSLANLFLSLPPFLFTRTPEGRLEEPPQVHLLRSYLVNLSRSTRPYFVSFDLHFFGFSLNSELIVIHFLPLSFRQNLP